MKVTEEALEQEIAPFLASQLGCEWLTQVRAGRKKPDIILKSTEWTFAVELEIGKRWRKFVEGVIQAEDARRELQADGAIAIWYPESARKVVASQEDLRQIAFALPVDAMVVSPLIVQNYEGAVLADIASSLKSHLDSKKRVISPEVVARCLRDCVQSISLYLARKEGISQPVVVATVGSFELFKVFATDATPLGKYEKEIRLAALDLASYMLVNQLLLYHILATVYSFPALKAVRTPAELKGYFSRVTNIDYRAVYSVDLVNMLPKGCVPDINIAIAALKAVRPEYVPHDLLGRIFHQFLPSQTRKILGAFYTKPVAAEILAGLCIDSANDRVIDAACGSGTLLVAAYHRKHALNPTISHSQMVEEHLVGIDVMPFAAHLAAMNLSIQNPQQRTNRTLVGIANSLSVQPGEGIGKVSRVFQRFLGYHAHRVSRVRESVDLTEMENFVIPKDFQVVIMNPPFTRKERLTSEMKGRCEKAFGRSQNYWAYFLALADSLLSEAGRMGLVLPRDFVSGQNSEEVRKWLFVDQGYKMRYIVKTLRDVAFSESSMFRDYLVVIEKRGTAEQVGIIYLEKKLQDITLEDAQQIAGRIRSVPVGQPYSDTDITITWEKQEEIESKHADLSELVLYASPMNSKRLRSFFTNLVSACASNLSSLSSFPASIKRGIEPHPKGMLNAVFMVRPLSDERIQNVRLVIQEETSESVIASIKGLKKLLRVPKSHTAIGLKTASHIGTFDVSDAADRVILKRFKELPQVLQMLHIRNINFGDLNRQAEARQTYLAVGRRMDIAASGTQVLAFFSSDAMVCGKAFWCFPALDRPLAKLFCLWFNSCFGILQLLRWRTETRGSWCELTKEGLESFLVPNLQMNKVAPIIDSLFEKYGKIKHTSLLEEFQESNDARRALDLDLLGLLGVQKESITTALPAVYEAIADELRIMKESMSKGTSNKHDEALLFEE
jgi:hypothetical protein